MTDFALDPAPPGAIDPFLDDAFASEIDRVAARLRQDIDCDSVMVNVPIDDERLLSLAVGLPGAYDPPRIQTRRGSLCDFTSRQSNLLRVVDARVDPAFEHAPQVASGQVVAYLGHPVADSRRTPYGAICATSLQPRRWTRTDAAMLASAACVVESLFLIRQLKREEEELLAYISDADRALLSLSKTLAGLISVHGKAGEELFSTAELKGVVAPEDLERVVADAVRARDAMAANDPVRQVETPIYIGVYENALMGRLDGRQVPFTLQLWQSAVDTYHAYWKCTEEMRPQR